MVSPNYQRVECPECGCEFESPNIIGAECPDCGLEFDYLTKEDYNDDSAEREVELRWMDEEY